MKVKDTHAFVLIGIGILFLISMTTIFFWHETLSRNLAINDSKFSSYGTTISGLVGTFWSLAGVILFYVALTEQRKDMDVNRRTLEVQTAALREQVKEFELQTKELEATRSVYVEQSKTQQIQRFESTFFQMLTLHHTIVNAMSSVGRQNRDIFKALHNRILEKWKPIKNEATADVIEIYEKIFDIHQEVLSHYFRNLYHIFKFIAKSDIENKKFYAALVRAQLSLFELLLLFYNCLSVYGSDKFKPLIEKFALFKNLDWTQVQGGKENIKKYRPQAYGHIDFDFLNRVDDWI